MEIHNCIKCGELATRKKLSQTVHMDKGYTVTTEDYYCKAHAPPGAVFINEKPNQPSLAAFMDVPLVKDLKGEIRPERKKQ